MDNTKFNVSIDPVKKKKKLSVDGLKKRCKNEGAVGSLKNTVAGGDG